MTYKEAQQIADRLIQNFIGPDYRVMDMCGFFESLVQALQQAHAQGWRDRAETEKLVRH
jgi:hypothetical protein